MPGKKDKALVQIKFPNVFRRWRRESQRWRDGLAREAIDQGASRGLGGDPGQDPQNVVVGTTTVMDELNRMPKELRNAVALVLDGHTYAEAAAMLGTTPKAIEGRLYRYRQAGSAARPAPTQQKEHSAAS
jgi:RNA polymerase sigma-70 factor (ECF subfamily)